MVGDGFLDYITKSIGNTTFANTDKVCSFLHSGERWQDFQGILEDFVYIFIIVIVN